MPPRRDNTGNSGNGQENQLPQVVLPQELTDALTVIAQGFAQQHQPPPPPPPQHNIRFFYGEMRKMRVLEFGGCTDPEEAQHWLAEVEKCFRLVQVPEEIKVDVVTPLLCGKAGE